MVRSVRGPRSALTSFLEERGIRNSNPAPRINQVVEEEEEVVVQENTTTIVQEVAIEEEVVVEEEMQVIVTRATTRSTRNRAIRYNEPNDLEAEAEIEPVKTKKKSVKKGKKKGSDYEEDSDSDFLPPEQAAKSKFSSKQNKGIGGVTFCLICKRRFVVNESSTKRDNGFVCPNCIKSELKKGALPIKRTSRQTKRRRRANALGGGLGFFDKEEIPTLRSMCIQVICDYIESVESFGNLSTRSMNQISRILSKHRKLDDLTLPLFLDGKLPSLSLFDCARLSEESLIKIGKKGGELIDLKIQFCGRMNDNVLLDYSLNLTNLTRLTLHGAFLVTENGFDNLFNKIGPNLTQLSIQHSPRFHIQSMTSLTQYCLNLIELDLSHCAKFDDHCILKLVNDNNQPSLTELQYLKLDSISIDCTDESLIAVLPHLKLKGLSLSHFKNLSDEGLICSIKPNFYNLWQLNLDNIPNLSPDSLINLFTPDLTLNRNLKAQDDFIGLSDLNLSNNNILIDDIILLTLFQYHHSTLVKLNISGLDSITPNGIINAFQSYPPTQLTHLDLSWVRAVSDPILEQIIAKLPNLVELKVWGCHRVTESLNLNNIKINIVGRECDTL